MPPAWSLRPMWIGIYSILGYSSYMVWRDRGGFKGACLPLTTYVLNIILNWSWAPLFFGSHHIKLALYENMTLCINTATLLIIFHDVNPIVGYLNISYLCWNIFSVMFNYFIYRHNKQIPANEEVTDEKIEGSRFRKQTEEVGRNAASFFLIHVEKDVSHKLNANDGPTSVTQ